MYTVAWNLCKVQFSKVPASQERCAPDFTAIAACRCCDSVKQVCHQDCLGPLGTACHSAYDSQQSGQQSNSSGDAPLHVQALPRLQLPHPPPPPAGGRAAWTWTRQAPTWACAPWPSWPAGAAAAQVASSSTGCELGMLRTSCQSRCRASSQLLMAASAWKLKVLVMMARMQQQRRRASK
jgi:hypothetical protein